MQALKITDMSELVRYGVKGPEATNWLIRHKVALPTKANTWLFNENTIVMRLGTSEFLIEDQVGGDLCPKLLPIIFVLRGCIKCLALMPHIYWQVVM
jgi:sarcosine oxidase, subunit gamma